MRRERPLKATAVATYEQLWPRFGLAPEAWAELGRCGRPVVLDIGFGDGEALLTMAAADPKRDYVGIEMYRTGIVKTLRGIEDRALTNVRLVQADALGVVGGLGDGSLDAIHIFFPDPWPKARHHKRRLVRSEFLEEVARTLRPGGLLHMATDWESYADEVVASIAAQSAFLPTETGRGERPITKFERRGLREGRAAHDLRFIRGSANQ
ncbi:MAG: tRNA (guanosine(46)-N7)-methyltransferase TrmB [Acidiferrobacter sp.]